VEGGKGGREGGREEDERSEKWKKAGEVRLDHVLHRIHHSIYIKLLFINSSITITGFGGNADQWAQNVPDLNPYYRVFALDLLGKHTQKKGKGIPKKASKTAC